MSELEKLQDLYSMGFIGEEEFENRKMALGIAKSTTEDNNGPSDDPV